MQQLFYGLRVCTGRLSTSFNEWIIARTDEKYNNLLTAPACICTLCIAIYLTLNIGISMEGETRIETNKIINILRVVNDLSTTRCPIIKLNMHGNYL